jgi:predicted porin
MVFKTKFDAVTVQLEYMVNNGDKAAQPQGGTGRALGVAYASGPINVGFAYTAIEADKAAGFDNATTHMTAGAGYNFGDGKVSVGYAKNTIKASGAGNPAVAEDTNTNMWLGASYNLSSKATVTAAYYKNAAVALSAPTSTVAVPVPGSGNEATKNTVMVGVTYALSKATALYFEMDRAVSNAGGAAIDATTVGTAAGLSTSF